MPASMLFPATDALLRFQEAERCMCTLAPTDDDLYAAAVASFPEISWPTSDSLANGKQLNGTVSKSLTRQSKHCMVRSKSYDGLSRLDGSSTSLPAL